LKAALIVTSGCGTAWTAENRMDPMTLTNKPQKKNRNHILLAVDDYPDNLLVLRKLIGKYLPDCELLTAVSAREGLELVAERPLDVILLDVQMPEMDGIEMCRRLKSDERTARIPVILMTAHMASPEQKAEGLNAGADDFITKPIENIELTAKINVMLRIKSAEDDLRETNLHLEDLVDERTRALRESEDRLSSFMNSASDSFYLLDSDLNFVEINERGLEIIGKDREEVIGKNITEIVPDVRESGRYDEHLKVLNTGKPFVIDDFVPHPKFGDLHFLFKSFKAGDGLGVIASDITERKQAEERLRYFQRAVDGATDAIGMSTPDGRHYYQNEAMTELFSLSTEEIDGTSGPPSTIYADEAVGREVFETIMKGETWNGEVKMIGKDGRELEILLQAYSIKDENDKVIGLVGVHNDITARKRADEERQKLATLIRYSSELVNLASLDGKMIFLNDAGSKMLGIDPNDVESANIIEVIPDHLKDLVENELLPTLFRGGIWEGDLQYRNLKTGKLTDVHVTTFTVKDPVTDKPIYLANTSMDITERKRAEEALREREATLSSIFRAAPIGIGVVTNRVIQQANKRFCEMVGYTREELLGQSSRMVYPTKKEFERVGKEKYRQLSEGKTGAVETRFKCKDGHIIDVILCSSPLDTDNHEAGVTFTVLDITERKRAEEAVRESEKKYRTLTENINVGIFRNTPGPKGKFIEANPALIKMFGFESRDEFLSIDVSELYQDQGERGRFSKKMLREGSVRHEELYLKKRDGTPIICSVTADAIRDAKGKIIFYDGIIENITARKRAAEEVKKERDRAQNYLDIAGVMFVAINTEGEVTLINKKGCEILGYAEGEILGRNWFENFVPERIRKIILPVSKILLNGEIETAEYYENPILNKQGEERLIAWHNSILRDDQGNIIAHLSSGEDITERKLAEEALRFSEERLKLALKGGELGFWDWNVETGECYFDKQWIEMLGYSVGELKQHYYTWKNLLHPDDQSEVLKKLNAHFRDEKVLYEVEMRLRTKSGEWKWILGKGEVVERDKNGKPLRMAGTHLDITEHRQAEEALKESEERFRALTESTSDWIWELDLTGTLTYANPNVRDILGYSAEEITGKTISDFIAPEEKSRNEELFRNQMKSPQGFKSFATLARHKDGHLIYLDISSVPVFTSKGDLDGFRGITRDITERKQAEEAVRLERDRAQKYLDVAGVMLIALDTHGKVSLINHKGCEILGYKEEDIIGKKWFDNFLPQRNRKDVKKAFERLIAGDVENVGYFENPVVTCSGEERILAWHNVLLYDESRRISGTLSSGDDITERRLAEEALLRTRFSVDRALDSIYWIDSEGRFLDVNDAACRELGYSKEELITMGIKDIVSGYSEDYETEIWPERWKAVKERGSVTFESKHRRKDGSDYPVDISTSIVEFGGKEFMCAFSRDITERKQAEEAINTLVTSTMGSIGQEFFDRIVKSVCEWLGTECAIIGQIMEDKTVNALSMYVDGEFIENYSYFLGSTPCETVIKKGFCVYPEGVCELFPDDKDLVELGAEGYVGTSLKDKNENAIGILCTLSRSKLDLPRRTEEVMGIIAAKASSEIDRMGAEEALRESEEKFRELAELLPEFVFEMDERGILTFVNRQSFDKSGYTHEDFAEGLKAIDLLVTADRKRARRNINKVMQGKAPVHNEYTARRKDGSEFPVIIRSTRIMQEGRPVGLRGIMFDITEQKLAEEALRKERSKLETGLKLERLVSDVASRLNSSESFYIIMDELLETIGKVLDIDRTCFFRLDDTCESAVKLYTEAKDQKKSCSDVIQASMIPAFFKRIKKNKAVISADLSELAEEERDFFDNQGIKAVLGSPLSVAGQVRGFIVYFKYDEYLWLDEEISATRTISAMIAGAWERDSHFQARLEAERKQTEAVQMAEKAARLASLGTLAAGIAHEINQPLTALKVEVDGAMLLLEKNKRISMDENVETLSFVSSQASRIDEIVSHMRALARQETEEKPTSLNFNKVIRKALSLVDEQIYSHGIELKVETDKSLPLLKSHETLLEQVVINLVVNAMNALDAHESGEKTIEVSTSYSGGNAVLTVRDNGPGIEPEHLGHIFDPFFTTKTDGVGMGLGLSITENLVTGLGGTISVANHEQGGAIFTISLPVTTSNQ
jgi:PAS domain S-box-containing protein